MNPSEDPPKQLDLAAIPTRFLTTASSVLQLTAWLLVTALVCHASSSGHASKTVRQASAQGNANIDPDAMDALNKMGAYLRSLKAFQVESEVTSDDVLDDGEIITDIRTNTLLAVSPNLLRAELKSDDADTFIFYDGKNFTVYGKLLNYYASVPAPATTAELVDKVYNDYGIEIPLVDLFKWGTDNSAIKKITSAVDLGPSTAQGITCEHYAFRQQGLDWQIWIQLGEYPLPRKLIIRTITDDARPQHTSNLIWNLAPSYNDAAFAFDPPAGALRIVLRDLNAEGTKADGTRKDQ